MRFPSVGSLSQYARRDTPQAASDRRRPSPLLFPRRLDDVAVRIAALDADIFGLVPLLDQLDAIGGKPVAQRENGVAVRQADPKCIHDGRAIGSSL